MGLNTSAIKDGNMVFPSRLAHPDFRFWKIFFQKVSADF